MARAQAKLGTLRAALVLAAALMIAVVASAGAATKPKVPVGRDPGGVAIALIGPGVDYRQPEVASLLARDGEGEIIGWDAIDGDRRPFAQDGADPLSARGMHAAKAIAREAPRTRIAVFKTERATAETPPPQQRRAEGIGMAALSPARIALVIVGDQSTLIVQAAAQRFPGQLFIQPVELPAATAAAVLPAQTPAQSTIKPNLLVVAADQSHCPAGPAASATASPTAATPTADLAAPVPCDVAASLADATAAARVTALAARIQASKPTLTAAEVKTAIIARAAMPDIGQAAKAARWLSEPALTAGP